MPATVPLTFVILRRSGVEIAPETISYVLRVREMLASDDAVAEFPATVVDAANGVVEVSLDDMSGIPGPGVYIAELAALDTAGVPIFANVFTLYLEPSLFLNAVGAPGPPSIMEVRLSLRDSSSAEKRLLDTTSWDNAEIALAVVRPVQYFNEDSPPLSIRFDTTNFPSRYHWCLGIAANLFYIAAEYFRANHLPYQAGGIAVDDMGKAEEYERAADKRWAEYKAWVKSTKVGMNMAEGWGDIPSQYGTGFGTWGHY